jgi:hypothetical protein
LLSTLITEAQTIPGLVQIAPPGSKSTAANRAQYAWMTLTTTSYSWLCDWTRPPVSGACSTARKCSAGGRRRQSPGSQA